MDEWISQKRVDGEVRRRGQIVGGTTEMDDNMFILADWIKRASERNGQEPTQQIIDIVKARKYVPDKTINLDDYLD